MTTTTTFGIIGHGRFGQLWGHALSAFGDVMVYEKNHCIDVEVPLKMGTLQEVVQCDMIFILVPISEFEALCRQIKDDLNPNSLLIDCCSVKIYPAKIMQEIFSSTQPIIGTHPLFGPDSVKKSGGLGGHKIVLCPIQQFQEKLPVLEAILQQLHLNISIATPEEHDKQMASSQSLVHFIGRGLAALDLRPQELCTPDFQALLNINNMVINDTWQLFLDMHTYNPYAKQIRKKFVESIAEIGGGDLMVDKLEMLREEINKIDEGIVKLLAERQSVVQAIGRLKTDRGVGVVNLEREQALSEFHQRLSVTHSLSPEFVARLFEMIILESRKLQKL